MTSSKHSDSGPQGPEIHEGDEGTDPTLMRWRVHGGDRVLMLRGTPPGAETKGPTRRADPVASVTRPSPEAAPEGTSKALANASVSDTEVVEILDGEVMVGPRPGPAEARAAIELLGELRVPLGLGEGSSSPWILLKEPELSLGSPADRMVPDLAGWRREQLPSRPTTTAIEVAPEWVCEVLSSSTRLHDRALKMPCYLKHGVRYLWLLDPSCELLEVYAARNGQWSLAAVRSGRDRVREEPFTAAEFPLGRLWQW